MSIWQMSWHVRHDVTLNVMTFMTFLACCKHSASLPSAFSCPVLNFLLSFSFFYTTAQSYSIHYPQTSGECTLLQAFWLVWELCQDCFSTNAPQQKLRKLRTRGLIKRKFRLLSLDSNDSNVLMIQWSNRFQWNFQFENFVEKFNENFSENIFMNFSKSCFLRTFFIFFREMGQLLTPVWETGKTVEKTWKKRGKKWQPETSLRVVKIWPFSFPVHQKIDLLEKELRCPYPTVTEL